MVTGQALGFVCTLPRSFLYRIARIISLYDILQGGCCKTCGEVTHLAKDCPKKGTQVYAGPGVSSNRCKSSCLLL